MEHERIKCPVDIGIPYLRPKREALDVSPKKPCCFDFHSYVSRLR
jgi:hypothetical protein